MNEMTLPIAIVPGVYRVPACRGHYSVDQVDDVMTVAEAVAATVADLIVREDPFKDGKRWAFVSFVTPAYRWGLVVWLRSLRKVSKRPAILLVSRMIQIPSDISDVYQIVVPGLSGEQLAARRDEFKNVFAKLWIFALTPLDRVFFIDIDCLILGPIEHLFEGDEFLVCPDYVETRQSENFNSGVMVLSPTPALRDHIFATVTGIESDDGGDQGALNVILGDRVSFIDERYNLLRHFFYYSGRSIPHDVRIVHYIVKKPWELQYRESPDGLLVELDDLWTSFLTPDELLQLIKEWRRSIFFMSQRARIENVRGSRTEPLAARLDVLEEQLRNKRQRLYSWLTLVAAAVFGAAFALFLKAIVK